MSEVHLCRHDPGDAAAEAALEAVLRRRSQKLAGRQLTPQHQDVHEEVIVARRAGVSLAVPLSAADEVRTIELVAVPGSGEVVNGLFQIRGQVRSLVDLAPFFGPAEPLCHGQSTLSLLFSDSGSALGLRIDEIVGPRSVLSHEIDQGLQEQDIVSCVTKDLVHILDIHAVMASPAVRLGGPGR